MNALSVGDDAPPFSLTDQSGKVVSLSGLLEKGPVVLFFYPKDETAVCTREACAFRDDYSGFAELGAQLFGISRDSDASHQSFRKNHALPYSLLSDPKGEVARRYGVSAAFGLLPGRATFVVDQGGKICLSYAASLRASAHVEQALSAVRGLAISDGQ